MHSTSNRPRFYLLIALLGALTAMGPMAVDMYLPAFASVEAQLGQGAALTLTSFFIGLALGQLFYGPISDRFGRKKPLCAGLVLYIIASIFCANAGSMNQLVVLRFIQGLGACSGMVLARAIVRDTSDTRHTAQIFSMLMLVVGVAPILAPMLGGWILLFSHWQGVFYTLTLYGLMLLFWTFFGLKESHDFSSIEPLSPGKVLRTYATLFRERDFMGYTFTGAWGMAGLYTFIAASAHTMMGYYHLTPLQYGWVFGMNAASMIISTQINAYFLRRNVSTTTLLRYAANIFPLISLSMFVCVWTLPMPPLWLTMLGCASYMATLGFVNPNAGALALAEHGKKAGTASALMGALQFSLAAGIGMLMDCWQALSPRPLTTIMAMSGLLSWLVFRIVVSPKNKKETPPT